MSKGQIIEIELWDEKIRLNTTLDAAYVNRIAEHLNNTMKEVSKDSSLHTTKIAALRAAFLIAANSMMMMDEMGATADKFEKVLDFFD